MRPNLINHILRSVWAIDKGFAQSVLPWVVDRISSDVAPGPPVEPREKSEPYAQPVQGVGYIFASGTIGKYLGLSEGGIDLAILGQQLRAFAASPLQALVLHLDSPGGTVSGVSQTAKLISRIQEETGKQIFGYTDTMACSAAQWILAPCELTFCDHHAHLGSIGCYSAIVDASELWKRNGTNIELVTSGKFKGAGAFSLPMSDEQKEAVRQEVNAIANAFKSDMTTYRGEIPDEYMEGQSFMGADAMEANLCDYLADSIEDVFRFAVDATNNR